MSVASPTEEQIRQILRRCEGVYSEEELRSRLKSGKQLRVKLGMDPTAPDLTLGHTVVLRLLRAFQDLGHKAVLIIGDYTAMIGDPTGKSKTRPVLSPEQIDTNAETYLAQAGKVLDLSEDKLEVRRNSEWLAPMTCADVIRLMSQMTVARMLERDTFANRQAEGKEIYLHELLYPLMQARDSVEIKSDIELGGSDQTFNNLCGRDLQRQAKQPPQVVMVTPLLVGTDGREKMSKSVGNYVAVTDPPGDMFGKSMRIPDELMRSWFELLTPLSEDEIAKLVDPKSANPRESKERLAKIIIEEFHSAEDAESAAKEFARVHGGGGGGLPDDIPEVDVPADILDGGKVIPADLVVACLGEKSKGAARRLIDEGGVRLGGEQVQDATTPIEIKPGDVLQRGKRKFVKLKF